MSPINKFSSDFTPRPIPLVRQPEDWVACEPKCFVGHRPTRSMFELDAAPDKGPDDPLRLDDYRARLVHVCDGHPQPRGGELTTLCREAVLMGLHFLGVVKLTPVPDEPTEEGTEP